MIALPSKLALALVPLALAAPGDDADFQHRVRPFLARHCFECHSGFEPKADLDLARFESAERALGDPDAWIELHAQLSAGEMPPKGQPRPAASEIDAVLAWVEERFELEVLELASIDPGRPTLRRLNHTEYRNTVRDLTGVDFPADEVFPTDAVGHGFDTVGDALSMSGLLFEQYLEAAEVVARRAIALPEPGPPRERAYSSAELSGDGLQNELGRLLYTTGEAGVLHRFPRDGAYLLRANAWAQQAGPELARMELTLEGRTLGNFEVAAARARAERYVATFRAHEGELQIGARFVNDYYEPEHPDETRRDRNLIIESLEIVGPLDPPSVTSFQEELFRRFGPELGKGRLAAVLAELGARAWRRPLDERELGRLERLVEDEAGFETQVLLGLQALLSSPNFLFRLEPDPPELAPGSVRALDAHELATRLSYFLWSTTPDAELRALADRGALVEEEVLAEQVERLLASPRARALADNFAAQWLQVRNLERAAVDPERFPDFDAELRAALAAETIAVFDALLREDRSVWELLEADTTFVNERSAEHYGLQGVRGPELRRVSLEGSPRRGVLGQAAILTVTSDPTRTSPVKRGKWILETLLGATPPPPPPGVDSLDESPQAQASASLRARIEQHRSDPSCAVCHDVLDPLGLALENFDAVGAWRERDGEFEVDASGALPDGRSFEGPLGLVALLRADDDFLRCLVERLFVYALGRGLERADRRTIEAVLAGLDPAHPTLRAMIGGIVRSDAFRMRRVEVQR